MWKAALSVLLAAALIFISSAEAEGGWRVAWTNPRVQKVPKSMWIELYKMKPGTTIPREYADEDGGYTFHVYLKTGPKLYMFNQYIDYTREHVEYAWKVVAAWNASLKFAADNYEWGRHLSKLRLKFYTDENVSQAPYVDIVVDPTRPCPVGAGCTYLTSPILIVGYLDTLSHELGHALGLGHNYLFSGGSFEKGLDWRGWSTGGIYPADVNGYTIFPPPDTFVLYALAVRWRSLKNSTAHSPVEFDGNPHIVRYNDEVGLLYSNPGLVWAYYYTVLFESGGPETPLLVGGYAEMGNVTSKLVKPLPYLWSWSVNGLGPVTFYGGTLCVHPLDWDYAFYDKGLNVYSIRRGSELPIAKVYDNGTALVLTGLDVSLALVDSRLVSPSSKRVRDVWAPKKYLSAGLLDELGRDRFINELYVIDGIGPAWDKVSKVSYKNGKVCLEGLRDRVLVEMRLGRAYAVEAGMAEAVPVDGWSYRDSNGTNWVLRGSTVYFRPLNDTYTSGGVKYLWRGVNISLTVDRPLKGDELVGRLWRKQYFVEVDSHYPFEGVGWFDEGSKALPKPKGGYVDLGNGTRLLLKGFEGYNGTEITVDRPLKLKPIWERMYRVDTVSRYFSSEAGKYFMEGERLFILMPLEREFGNGTKVELLNITAYGPGGEFVKAWNGKSGGAGMALLRVDADKPLTIRVDWRVYHRLTVTSELNSYEAWVINGTAHRLDLPEKRLVGEGYLYVLKEVRANGEAVKGLEITVDRPTSVEARYQRKVLTTFMVHAGGGYLVEPGEVALERDGEAEVYRPPFTYIGEGAWRVVRVVYLGRDVSVPATVEISAPGMKTVPSRLRVVEVAVVDLLHIPVPYATVKAEDTGGITGLSGTMLLHAVPPWDFEVTVSHLLGEGRAAIQPGGSTVRVVAGISPYTVTLLAAVGVAGVAAWKRRVRR